MSTPALTPAEYADAYRYWQQQETDETAAEIADLLDQHSIRQRAAVVRVEAIAQHHDTPEAQAHRLAVLKNATQHRAPRSNT